MRVEVLCLHQLAIHSTLLVHLIDSDFTSAIVVLGCKVSKLRFRNVACLSRLICLVPRLLLRPSSEVTDLLFVEA